MALIDGPRKPCRLSVELAAGHGDAVHGGQLKLCRFRDALKCTALVLL